MGLNAYLMKALVVGSIVLMIGMAVYDYGDNAGYSRAEKKYMKLLDEKSAELLSAKQTVLEIERQSVQALEMAYEAQAEATIQARKQSEALQVDINRLSAANDSLRDKAKRYSDRLQRCSATANGSDSTQAAGDMLPELLGRCGDALGIVSEYADRARISGLACQSVK